MTVGGTHRLDGLEPDNLLAFMALLGLLRTLEEARPRWRPRASWTVAEPPLRPRLHVVENVGGNAVAEAAAEGLTVLARHHDFDGLRDLTLAPEDARRKLRLAADSDSPYAAHLWSALFSDAVVRVVRDGVVVEPTPLCLLGQGKQYFLSRLASVPREKVPLTRGSDQKRRSVSEAECLSEALFAPWQRPDQAKNRSFRWDPHEDVRHALRANDPTDRKTKEGTQHGANRLAAVGLSVLTVVPRQSRGGVHLALIGGSRERNGVHTVSWPIWREPVGLSAIRALLAHPHLDDPDTRAALGVVERRRAKRIFYEPTSRVKFMNLTRAVSVVEDQTLGTDAMMQSVDDLW